MSVAMIVAFASHKIATILSDVLDQVGVCMGDPHFDLVIRDYTPVELKAIIKSST